MYDIDDPQGRVVGLKEYGAHLGKSWATMKRYMERKLIAAPDFFIGDRPHWYWGTILKHEKNAPKKSSGQIPRGKAKEWATRAAE
ncbi:hypothetical protein [Phyllobacterium lublinensis]|uniref:hypothetical protein n=1 Tax=Phyllobacterium lublinensis TaxID=2875708 RepID=UPI001CCBE76A|nr:hypothetical protein [Phyllobacterium sp. 2063]MBZ9654354.1 hypothetical protein [Phyllobacterium sp. 2063]